MIPASQLVTVNPGVVTAGGSATAMTGLLLTQSQQVPIKTVLSFPSQLSVANYFGAASAEASWATNYFNGFDSSPLKPANLLVAQYNTAAVPAWLRGGQISGLTLTQLQAITSGVLTVTIDGTPLTSSTINLSAATGFVNAAQIINQALGATTPGVDGVVTAGISATTMTVSAVSSGQIQVGDVLTGSGVTAGTYVTAFGTGTGGTGTYTVSASQTVGSTAITASLPAVTYNTQAGAFQINSSTTGSASTIGFGSGTISAALLLTSATGAVTSQGAAIATPSGAMNNFVGITQAFATFSTLWNAATADKIAFSLWSNGQNNRFLYVMPDTDVTVTAANPTTSAGYQINLAGYSGTAMIYDPNGQAPAAFLMGSIASINFGAVGGRFDLALRTQSGLTPGVTSLTVAQQLITNGYNYYGGYGAGTTGFNVFYNGSVTGPFKWIDSFANQQWMNTALQASLLNLLTATGSVPYNDAGYNMIRQACMDTINSAVGFGAIRAGVPLSASQIAAVNAAAGTPIDQTLATRGWYLQVQPASPTVRAARGSPPITLWYMDGQDVQQITLGSLEVQ